MTTAQSSAVKIQWNAVICSNFEMLSFAATWVELGISRVSELSQAQKGKYYRISLLYRVQTVWVIEAESRIVVARNQDSREEGGAGKVGRAHYPKIKYEK